MKRIIQITGKYVKVTFVVIFLAMIYSCGTHKSEKIIGMNESKNQEQNTVSTESSNSGLLSDDNINFSDTWELTKMNGKAANELFDKVPTLGFDKAESRVQGFAGCNRYSGGYSFKGNNFIVSKLMTTRMMCHNKNDEFGFTQAMESINTAKHEGNNLYLYKDEQLVLEFVKK